MHIPKCAGTSLEVALGVADGYPNIGLTPVTTSPHVAALFGGGLQHLTIREIVRNFPDITSRASFSFAIVRDPVDRFVSHIAWKHYRFLTGTGDGRLAATKISTEIENLESFYKKYEDAFENPFEGAEFCEGDANSLPINAIERHILPQSCFLFYQKMIGVGSLYPLESILALETELCRRRMLVQHISQRMVSERRKWLRRLLTRTQESVIRAIYRYDVRLHSCIREISARAENGCCTAEEINVEPFEADRTRGSPRVLKSKKLPRKIWMYWAQGWENAPTIVKNCLKCWRERNPTWNVVALDDLNLAEFIEMPSFYAHLFLPYPARSDVIRLRLLKKYGGVWADATTWCVRSLDEWVFGMTAQADFFAYAWPAPDRPIASWFIATTPEHHLLTRLVERVDRLWLQVVSRKLSLDVTDDPSSKDYFWLHRAFYSMISEEAVSAGIWDKVQKIEANEPHFLQNKGLLSPIDDATICHIKLKFTNVYKLTRRVLLPDDISGTILQYLFQTL